MSTIITPELFKEKFGDMMLNGRDSVQTYIPDRKSVV